MKSTKRDLRKIFKCEALAVIAFIILLASIFFVFFKEKWASSCDCLLPAFSLLLLNLDRLNP